MMSNPLASTAHGRSNFRTKIRWLISSGKFRMDMRIRPLKLKILLESTHLKSRIVVRRLAVRELTVPSRLHCAGAPS